jgi:hypothetical protein
VMRHFKQSLKIFSKLLNYMDFKEKPHAFP